MLWPQSKCIKAWYNDSIVAVWIRMHDGNYRMVWRDEIVARRGVDKLIVLENYE